MNYLEIGMAYNICIPLDNKMTHRIILARCALIVNPSRRHGGGLQRRHRGHSIQRRHLSTINPVAVVVSFEVCAMGSGIKGDYVRRHFMVLSGHRSSSFTKGGVHHRGLRLYRFAAFLASSLVRTKVGISIWDPGGFQFAELLLFCKAVQSDLFHRSQDHDNSSVSVVGKLSLGCYEIVFGLC